MPFDFPNNPAIGAIAQSPGGIYKFDGVKWSAGSTWLPLVGGTISPGPLHINAPSSDANLLLESASGHTRLISGATITSPTTTSLRWQIQPGNQTAEAAGNVGSDFAINRYDNAGAVLGTPFFISRATGNVAIPQSLIAGSITISNPNPFMWLTATGAPPNQKNVLLYTDTSGDFGMEFATDAQSGTGNFFQVNRSGAAASVMYLTSPTINLTGNTVTSGIATVNGGSLQINAPNSSAYSQLVLNKFTNTATTANQIASMTNGSLRWLIQLATPETESGGSAGSNFGLFRYDDSGGYLGQVFGIIRSTGNVSIAQTLNVGGSIQSLSGPITAGPAGVGQVSLSAGNSTNTGYLSFFNASGTRQGYIGYAAGGQINFSLEGSVTALNLIGNMIAGNQGIAYNLTQAYNFHAFGTDSGYFRWYLNGGYAGMLVRTDLSNGTPIYEMHLDSGTPQMIGSYPGGQIGWSMYWSDRRLKSDIEPANIDALDIINQLPVHALTITNPFKDAEPQHWPCALIADELETLIPTAYIKARGAENGGLDYDRIGELPLICTLVRAVQQLTDQVRELQARTTH